MKILAFSDLHLARNRAADLVTASADADLVIGAGDFCNKRQGLPEAMALLSGIRAPMLVVPGNAETPDELAAAANANMICVHGRMHEIGGLSVFGLGCAVPPTPFGDWSADLSEAEAEAELSRCDHADILVLHSPPKGVVDQSSAGQSLGSVSILAAIERIQPRMALCGHIHDSWGQEGMIGRSRVVNLGPTPTWFEL